MSMTPKMRLSPSARSASTPPSRMPLITASRIKSGSIMDGSGADVRLADEVLLGELARAAFHLDPPHLEKIGAVHDLEDLAHVLLDHEDGIAFLAHPTDEVEEAQHQHGRQAHGRLVEQDELRLRHEGAPHREQLLPAAGGAPRPLRLPLCQHREERVDALEALAVVGARGGQEGAHLE